MARPIPSTISQGRLFLLYSMYDVQHRTSVRLDTLSDPGDLSHWSVVASSLATRVAGVMTSSGSIHTWGLQMYDDTEVYREAFAVPIAGTHGSVTGLDPSNSRQVRILGKGVPLVPGNQSGRTSMAVFVGTAFQFNRGSKYISTGSDTDLANLVTYLNSTTEIFCDVYGQHASAGALVAVQYNAYVQRRYGT